MFNLIAALLLLLGYLMTSRLQATEWISPATPYIIVFFFLNNLFFFRIREKLESSGNRKFINRYLLVNSIKTVIYIGIVLTYALLRKDDALRFALSFLINYSIFTLLLVQSFTRIKTIN